MRGLGPCMKPANQIRNDSEGQTGLFLGKIKPQGGKPEEKWGQDLEKEVDAPSVYSNNMACCLPLSY